MNAPTIGDLRVEQIRAALLAIAARNHNLLAPEHVVDAARDPNSVLHSEFEWDDDVAAEAYRRVQAGALIRRVKLKLVRQERDSTLVRIVTVRAFQSRVSQRGGAKGSYEPVLDIMADPRKRDELIDQVLREMRSYRKRYADLMALQGIWDAIDDAVDAMQASAPSRHGAAEQALHVGAS